MSDQDKHKQQPEQEPEQTTPLKSDQSAEPPPESETTTEPPPPTGATTEPTPEPGATTTEPPPETPEEEVATPYNPNKEERTMAMLAHLLGGVLIITGFLGFLAPLIIWMLKKDEMPFVDDQAKEALNFQLMVLIVSVVLGIISLMTCGFGGLLYVPLAVVVLILCIMAAVKANEGISYRYPVNMRMIK